MNQPNNPCPTCGQFNNIICSNSYHLWVEPEIEADSLHVGETESISAKEMAESYSQGIWSLLSHNNPARDRITESAKHDFLAGYTAALDILYTHAELLAFGEKVKELAAKEASSLIRKESILSIDLNKIEIK